MAAECVRYNDPAERQYNQVVEVALNFLNVHVLREPYNPFPDDQVPILYSVVDDGVLAAAGSVNYPSYEDDRFAFLGLFAVAPEQQGRGFGRGLLEFIETDLRQLGALAVVTMPIMTYAPQPEHGSHWVSRVRGFFEHLEYTPHDEDLMIKYL